MRISLLAPLSLLAAVPAIAGDLSSEQRDRLLTAYPDHLERIEGAELVWRDGTRTPLDDGDTGKSFQAWLNDPDVEDMLAVHYPPGKLDTPPPEDTDPGRARNTAFFNKIYGDCRNGEVAKNLKTIVWLPKKAGQKLRVTKINDVADKLEAVSRELDALPASFNAFLVPSAGTYNCRAIAGTDRLSAHSYGIAIDIAVHRAHYWRDAKPGAHGNYVYRNHVPMEIVRIFEKHGFIWGGKWYHYDTMHFEYRPELLPRVGQE